MKQHAENICPSTAVKEAMVVVVQFASDDARKSET